MAPTASSPNPDNQHQQKILMDRIKRLRRFLFEARRIAELVETDPNLEEECEKEIHQEIQDLRATVKNWSWEKAPVYCPNEIGTTPPPELDETQVYSWIDTILSRMEKQNCCEVYITPTHDEKYDVCINYPCKKLDWAQSGVKLSKKFIGTLRKLSGNEIVYNDSPRDGKFTRIVNNQKYEIKIHMIQGTFGENLRMKIEKLQKTKKINITFQINEDLLKIIPANLAIKYQVIPVRQTDETLDIIMPKANNKTIDLLTNYVGKIVNPLIVEKYQFEKTLKHLYSAS